ncbi:MAG: SGNH/GDSL hydrolase family protein [Clostridium sp.]|nr:SGNH/GDSL hydrolase family protein [Bacteroides sp.]MCM1198793.1 SGNH/GDSL hydrolase family protein [Clostridium sp.]
MKKYLSAIASALMMLSTVARAQTVEPFADGDRAVFLGDSITDDGHYHSYIWLYYMTRFPYMDLTVLNSGIGGDTAAHMYKRLDGDVFSKRPTVLMVTFGMNDTGYFEYLGENAEAFGENRYREAIGNFSKMEERLKRLDGVRVVMIGGSPYDEGAKFDNTPFPGKNAVIQRIIEYQRQAAKRNGWEFIDFNAPLLEVCSRMQQVDSSFTISRGDRIHPDNDGHMVMAYLYLKAQGFAGQKVADIEVDVSRKAVLKEENCHISGLRASSREVSFDYLAESLPYPLDTIPNGFGTKRPQAAACSLVPFMEEMNQESLAVKGLNGDYTLYIDDICLGMFSAAELEAGINLAAIPFTPQYRQALAVMHLNEYRWAIERDFRDYVWMQYGFFQERGLLDANDEHAVKVLEAEKNNDIWLQIQRNTWSRMMHDSVREARQKEMELLTEKIYSINKPVVHRISLRKKQLISSMEAL